MQNILIKHQNLNAQILVQLLKSAFIKIEEIDNEELVYYSIDDEFFAVTHNEVDKTIVFSKLFSFKENISNALVEQLLVDLNGHFNIVFYRFSSQTNGILMLHKIDTEAGISRGNFVLSAQRFHKYFEYTNEFLENKLGVNIFQ